MQSSPAPSSFSIQISYIDGEQEIIVRNNSFFNLAISDNPEVLIMKKGPQRMTTMFENNTFSGLVQYSI